MVPPPSADSYVYIQTRRVLKERGLQRAYESVNSELVQSQIEGYNEHNIFCGAGYKVALKCPKCGKSAELPDGLAGGDHRCYSCNVYLQYADPSFIPKQEKEFKDQAYASILGAMLGACSILSIEVLGDKVGLAIAAGLAGALVGCLSGS